MSEGMRGRKAFHERLHWIPFDPELSESAHATAHGPSYAVGPSHCHRQRMTELHNQAQAAICSSPERAPRLDNRGEVQRATLNKWSTGQTSRHCIGKRFTCSSTCFLIHSFGYLKDTLASSRVNTAFSYHCDRSNEESPLRR